MATDDDILKELQEIHKLLTPAAAPPPPKGLLHEFKTFLNNYKVLGLAVAFIIGLYLGMLVQALVKDLILPLIGIPLGGVIGNLATYSVTFDSQMFMVGDFLNYVITFIVVAFVVFLIVKMANRYKLG